MKPRFLPVLFLFPLAVFAADPVTPVEEKPKPEKAAEAAPPKAAQEAVRQIFVPLKKGETGKGASGTSLTRKGIDPSVLMAMAHIGLDETFLVHDEKGRQFFTVTMTAGDDKQLVFEVRAKDKSQKIAVVRDEPTEFLVDGLRYEITFPTCRVNPDANPVTNQPMLFITQRP